MREEQKETKVIEYDGIEYEMVQDLTVNQKAKRKVLIWMNIMTFVILLAILAAGIIIIRYIHVDTEFKFSIVQFLLICLSFVVYVFLHEFIHGLVFNIAGKIPWKSITYGAAIKSGMAYCISEAPVNLRASRISLMAPFVIVCVPLIVCGIAFGNIALLVTGAFFASGSAGDFWYLWRLRSKPKDLYMIEEKPVGGEYKLGFYLLKVVA